LASYPASRPAPYRRGTLESSGGSGLLLKLVAVFLGFAAAVLAVVLVVMLNAVD
jgi:hypothetical protein